MKRMAAEPQEKSPRANWRLAVVSHVRGAAFAPGGAGGGETSTEDQAPDVPLAGGVDAAAPNVDSAAGAEGASLGPDRSVSRSDRTASRTFAAGSCPALAEGAPGCARDGWAAKDARGPAWRDAHAAVEQSANAIMIAAARTSRPATAAGHCNPTARGAMLGYFAGAPAAPRVSFQ